MTPKNRKKRKRNAPYPSGDIVIVVLPPQLLHLVVGGRGRVEAREPGLVLADEVEDLDVGLVPLEGGPVAVESGGNHVEDERQARVMGCGPVAEEIVQNPLISTFF